MSFCNKFWKVRGKKYWKVRGKRFLEHVRARTSFMDDLLFLEPLVAQPSVKTRCRPERRPAERATSQSFHAPIHDPYLDLLLQDPDDSDLDLGIRSFFEIDTEIEPLSLSPPKSQPAKEAKETSTVRKALRSVKPEKAPKKSKKKKSALKKLISKRRKKDTRVWNPEFQITAGSAWKFDSMLCRTVAHETNKNSHIEKKTQSFLKSIVCMIKIFVSSILLCEKIFGPPKFRLRREFTPAHLPHARFRVDPSRHAHPSVATRARVDCRPKPNFPRSFGPKPRPNSQFPQFLPKNHKRRRDATPIPLSRPVFMSTLPPSSPFRRDPRRPSTVDRHPNPSPADNDGPERHVELCRDSQRLSESQKQSG